MIRSLSKLACAVRRTSRSGRPSGDTTSRRAAATLTSGKVGAVLALLGATFLGAAGEPPAGPALADLDSLAGAIVLAAAEAPWTDLGPGARSLDLRVEYGDQNHRLFATIFDPARWRLRVAPAFEPDGFRVDAALGKGEGLAVNGGYFDYRDTPNGRTLVPTGLVIADGSRLAGYRGGSGVLYDTGKGIGIAWAKDRKAWAGAVEALQVGPLLVDPGGQPGIRRQDGPRARRSAVCATAEGEVAVVVVTSAISLYDFAEVLADTSPGGFACERAINLDGGPSTQVFGRFGKTVIDLPGGSRVVNAVVFERR